MYSPQGPIEIPNVWESAIHKSAFTDEPTGCTVDRWFVACGTRYEMDQRRGHDWYQIDTDQDASYYGTWCNPVTRQILSYTEGDITLVTCSTPDSYWGELARLLRWHFDHDGRAAIDDYDGEHDNKIAFPVFVPPAE